MPYASHRMVGLLELEPSNAVEADVVRWIGLDLATSRSTPPTENERIIKADAASLQRDLEVELAKLMAENLSAA